MEYLRQIDEDLTALSHEAKKKYPEVKESTERALSTLKTIRELYVSEMMKKSHNHDSSGVKFPQSSDISAPYILVCNYSDAPVKMVSMALNGLQMLLNFDIIPSSDIKNIMRVLSIQAGSGRSENQLKLLQILLQLANTLSKNSSATEYLTEQIVCAFLSVAFSLGDSRNNVSITSTALATARQIVAIVMNAAYVQFTEGVSASVPEAIPVPSPSALSASVTMSALLLVREVVIFVRGYPGEWVRGSYVPLPFALDLMYDILSGWKLLFIHIPQFKELVPNSICPAMKPLWNTLQDDYLFTANKSGIANAAGLTSRVTRIARCLLLDILQPTNLLDEFEIVMTLMIHNLHLDRNSDGGTLAQRNQSFSEPEDSSTSSLSGAIATGNIGNVAASLLQPAAGAIMKGLNIPLSSLNLGVSIKQSGSSSGTSRINSGSRDRDSSGGGGPGHNGLGMSNYLQLLPGNITAQTLQSPSARAVLIPAHPAGVSLEVLLSFFVSIVPHAMACSDEGCLVLCKSLTNTIVAVAQLLSSALQVEQNAKDFEAAVKGSQLITLLEGLLTGAETDIEYVSRSVHDHLVTNLTAESSEVLVLAFQVLQVSCRLLISFALETLPQSTSLPQVFFSASPRPLAHSNLTFASATSSTKAGSSLTQSSGNVASSIDTATSEGNSESVPTVPVTISFEPSSPVKQQLSFANQSNNSQQKSRSSFHAGQLTIDTNLAETPMKGAIGTPNRVTSPTGHRRYSTIFFSPQVFSVLPEFFPAARRDYIRSLVVVACDNAYDSIQEACIALLSKVDYAAVVRRSLGILAELSLSSGLLGLPRISDYVMATLCKYTVPAWHGQDLEAAALSSLAHSSLPPNALDQSPQLPGSGMHHSLIRWRHIQAQVRMLQVLSVLADSITDWDCVVDALDQIHKYYATRKFQISDEVSLSEVDKVFSTIDRFKRFSIFLSNDSLVRLMTSLVALSLNTLAVSATSTASGGRKRSSSNANGSTSVGSNGSSGNGGNNGNSSSSGPVVTGPDYMIEGLTSGFVSFSLEAVVDITKINAHRVSSVWQMVTSHLRMIASLKHPMSRQIAVASTHDIIFSAIDYLDSSKPQPISTTVFQPNEPISSSNASVKTDASKQSASPIHLCDQLIYNQILPSFENVFVPKQLHKECLAMREISSALNPELSQYDLLSSLKSLSFIRYEDVRHAVLSGLLQLLMTRGHLLTTGWPVIIELLASVPAPCVTNSAIVSASSLVDEDALMCQASGFEEDDDPPSSDVTNANSKRLLPRSLLVAAFNCAKFIADEFLHAMSIPDVKHMIGCFAIFAAQNIDLNISLSSVELLWRVCDHTLFRFKNDSPDRAGTTVEVMVSVVECMLQKLLMLSIDPRPELRNCAMNTLFTVTCANAKFMTVSLWRDVFNKVVFPLFDRAKEKSRMAQVSHESAATTELKKGVKMSLHHSRDTAHKQWAETRSLALKGLARMVRVCTGYLISEVWYAETWARSLDACRMSIQAADDDLEVALAGVDALFSMLKTCTNSTYSDLSSLTNTTASSAEQHSSATPVKQQISGGSKLALRKQQQQQQQSGAKGHLLDPYSDPKSVIAIESARSQLWTVTWRCVEECSRCPAVAIDVPLTMIQGLSVLYAEGLDGAFRYSETVRVLLEIVVVLSRPRMRVNRGVGSHNDAEPKAAQKMCYELTAPSTSHNSKMLENQLQRAVIALLKQIRMADLLSACSLASALAEIAFASRIVSVQNPFQTDGVVFLAPAPLKLRQDCSSLLIGLLSSQHPSAAPATVPPPSAPASATIGQGCTLPKGSFAIISDIIFKRFVNDICREQVLVRKRSLVESSSASAADIHSLPALLRPKDSNPSVIEVPISVMLHSTRGDDLFADIFDRSYRGPILASAETLSSATMPDQQLQSEAHRNARRPNAQHQLQQTDLQQHRSLSSTSTDESEGFLKSIERIWSNAINGGFEEEPTSISNSSINRNHTISSTTSSASSSSSSSGVGIHRFPTLFSDREAKVFEHPVGNAWGEALYFPLDIELEVLNKALNVDEIVSSFHHGSSSELAHNKNNLNNTVQSSILNESSWRNVVLCIACVLSPWRHQELCSFTSVSLQELIATHRSNCSGTTDLDIAKTNALNREHNIRILGDILDKIFSPEIQSHLWAFEGLCQCIIAIVQSSRLMVQCVRGKLNNNCWDRDSEGLGAANASINVEWELHLIAKVRKILVSCLNSASTSVATKASALEGYLTLTRDMCFVTLASDAVLSDDFVEQCFMFLTNIIEIDAPLDILPAAFDCRYRPREGHAANSDADWLEAVAFSMTGQYSASNHSAAGSTSSAAVSVAASPKHSLSAGKQHAHSSPGSGFASSTSVASRPAPLDLNSSAHTVSDSHGKLGVQETAQLTTKGHILLLLPLAATIVNSKYPDLRESALEILNYLDMGSIMSNYRQLSRRNSELEQSNSALRIELRTVKSAASLPF